MAKKINKEANQVVEAVETVETEAPVEEVVEEVKEEKTKEEKFEATAVVNCAMLNVRKAASTDSPVITVLNQGEKVKITKRKSENGFYSIELQNGATGYCMAKFISIR